MTVDPTKQVNYAQGMVLGVDDFVQEATYHIEQQHELTREALGYGTVEGLHVRFQPDGSDTQIIVEPGVAISPHGELITIPNEQCASLNKWLTAHRDELLRRTGMAGGLTQLYVVLCYRSCLIDNVPIAGDPCRSEDDTMAPSRIKDDYRLEIRFDPPDQIEEDAILCFVDELRRIPVSATANGSDPDAFAEAVRAFCPAYIVPPANEPAAILASPLEGITIPNGEVCSYLRSAFNIWITELRGKWLTSGSPLNAPPDQDECLLLAELDIYLTSQGQLDNLPPIVDESRRPELLTLRMLQEWILCGRVEVELSGDVIGPSENNTIRALAGTPLSSAAPAINDVLTYDGSQWEAAPLQFPPPPPINLQGDVTGSELGTVLTAIQGKTVADLSGVKDEYLLTFSGGEWTAKPLSGDVVTDTNDPSHGNVVTHINHSQVGDLSKAQDDNLLTFSGGAWIHKPLSGDVVTDTNDPSHGNVVTHINHSLLGNLNRAAEDDLLTFSAGAWTNKPLYGDVVINTANADHKNWVTALRGLPIASTQPKSTQVLQFDGKAWMPSDIVTASAPASPIVAAGKFDSSANRLMSFNRLEAKFMQQGIYLLTFPTYDQKLKNQYVVKGTPITPLGATLRATFEVIEPSEYQAEGFLVRVLSTLDYSSPDNKNPSPAPAFMVEISLFAGDGVELP